jgi:hypothetical protein
VLLQKTIPNAVFYNISLKGMDQMWQAYTLQVRFSLVKEVSLANFFATLVGFDLMTLSSVGIDDTTRPPRQGSKRRFIRVSLKQTLTPSFI